MTRSLKVLLVFVFACAAQWAQADAYPIRPVTVVVPYGAGGGTDLFARMVATELATRLKGTVVVENTAGAGGTIGVQRAMSAPPDGYTLVVSNGMEFEMLQMADPDSAKGRTTNLAPVALFGTQPMVLVVRPGLNIKTADEFVAYAKANPGKLSLASSGPGTLLYLAGEMVKKSAGIELLNVPYKNAPQIVTDLIGGSVDAAVLTVPTALPHVQAGKLVAVGVTDTVRSAALPAVPTLSESKAVKGVEAKVWYALYGPPQLAPEAAQKIAQASKDMLGNAAVREKLVALQVTPAADGSARELQALRDGQLAKFQSVFKDTAPAK